MKVFLLKTIRLLLMVVKPRSGLARFGFSPFLKSGFLQLPKPIFAEMADGLRIEIDPNDFNGRKLWLSGTNDWKVTDTVTGLLKPGDILLDIGANYGTVGLAARHKAGTDGHVHLFEPQPDLVRRVKEAIDAAGASNVTLHTVALFDRDGEFEMVVKGQHSGVASLVKTGAELSQSVIKVPTKRARDYVAPLVNGRDFGVKIDVEGAEPFILPDLIAFPELKFVVFEGNQNESELFDMLSAGNFVVFGFCKTVFATRLARVSNNHDLHKYHDFVAVRCELPKECVRLSPGELARRLWSV